MIIRAPGGNQVSIYAAAGGLDRANPGSQHRDAARRQPSEPRRICPMGKIVLAELRSSRFSPDTRLAATFI
jgi:hypothetical protein